MSNANEMAVRFKRQTDATPPVDIDSPDPWYTLRLLSTDLDQSFVTEESQLLDPTRRNLGTDVLGVDAAGSFDSELLYGAHDDVFESTLLSADWSAAPSDITDTDIEFDSASNSIRSATDDKFDSLDLQGRWVEISGAGAGSNAGKIGRIMQVTDFPAGTDNQLDIEYLDGGLADQAAGGSVTLRFSDYITDGTTRRLMDVELEPTDLTSLFFNFDGCVVESFDVTMAPRSYVNVVFNLLGRNKVQNTTTSVTGTENPAPATKSMRSSADVETLVVEGSGLTESFWQDQCPIAVDFSHSNGYNSLECIGQDEVDGHIPGGQSTTGVLRFYLDDTSKQLSANALSKTLAAIAVVFKDRDGNRMIFEFPRVLFTSAPTPVDGKNTQVELEIGWTGEEGPDATAAPANPKEFQIRMQRLAAA